MGNLELGYLLLAISVILLLAELFIPTGGICFLLAALCATAGIVLLFIYGNSRLGLTALIGMFVATPLLLSALFYLWPGSLWGGKLVPSPDDDMTIAAIPANAQLERFRGQIGRAVSPLRPAGVVEFEGKRVDCVSEGILIEADEWVKCVDVKAPRVVVRRIDKPRLQDLENTDFG
jgi:membrane-bound serine protease (ClpP class)